MILKCFTTIKMNGCENMLVMFSQNVPGNAKVMFFFTLKANVSNVYYFDMEMIL